MRSSAAGGGLCARREARKGSRCTRQGRGARGGASVSPPRIRLYTAAVKAAALVVVLVVLGAVAVVVAGVAIANRGSEESTAAVESAQADTEGCTYLAGWRRLADRIKAPVYCPGWIPTPLTAQIGGPWNNIASVDADRSYLMGFVWQETGFGGKASEVHVNFRGQPGNTADPGTCQDVSTVAGVTHRKNIPCFQEPALARCARRTGSSRRSTPSTTAPTHGTCCSPGAAEAGSTR